MNKVRKMIFISFEGIDGAGKTTQISLLKDYFKKKDYRAYFIKGHPAFYGVKEKIIDSFGYIDPLEAFLVTMAKHKAVEMEIQRYMEQPCIVVVDRYIDSSFAYTLANVKKDREKVKRLFDLLRPQFLQPDITFFINTSPKIALKRKKELTFDRIELGNGEISETEKEDAFLNNQIRAYKYYLEITRACPGRFILIDGMQTVEQIQIDIQSVIDEIVAMK